MELSSNRRSKTEMGACAKDRSGFVPSAASTIRRRARRAQLGAAPLLVGGPTTTHASRQRRKSRGGQRAPIKMLKMKVDPEMCMKTKEQTTICPTQKTTFLPGCTPFYTERYAYFAETVGSFVTIRALGNEPLLQNVETPGAECHSAVRYTREVLFYDERSQNVIENTQ